MRVLRNLFGFAVLAVVTIFLLKVVFGLFGLFVGLLGAVLWFAFVGFMIYLVLKLFAPGTAARVREMIVGER
jgi:thiol:disulfide interchange protein